MYGRQSDRSFEKTLEEEINRRLEFTEDQLDGLLHRIYTNVREKVKEKANTNEFGLKGYSAVFNFDCSKSEYGDIQCEHNIKISFYNLYRENDTIDCYSHSEPLPDKISDKIQCIHYNSNSSFELSNSNSLTEVMKYLILDRLNTENPDVLTDILSYIDKQNVNITAVIYSSGNNKPNIKMSYLPYKSRP
jgi:hypothetical protein